MPLPVLTSEPVPAGLCRTALKFKVAVYGEITVEPGRPSVVTG